LGEIAEDINLSYYSPEWLIPPGLATLPPTELPLPPSIVEEPCSRPGGCTDCSECLEGGVCVPKPCVFSGFNRMYTHSPIIRNDDGNTIRLESVREQVIDYITTHPIENLFITGHSLGAAVSTLLGADIKYNYEKYRVGQNNARIYTFAGPSCGNKDFYKLYSDLGNNYTGLFSIVNNRDPVPTLPEYVGYANPPPQKFCFTSTICGVDSHKTPTYTRYLLENWDLFDEGARANCKNNCGFDCDTEFIPPLL
jgi:hypothetical protein